MVVNYSKWDALELSDDSDIEVHPNVDKKSFIRAKQNQIHIEREKRRHEIRTLKYERIVNDGLMERIEALLKTFQEHAAQAIGGNPDEFAMNAVMDTTLPADQDKPPDPPADVHYKTKQPKYSEMIASLLDQVKKDSKITAEDDWYKKYLEGINEHKTKVQNLQKDLFEKLAELEKAESSKITSDSIHTGFDTSSISKEKPKPPPPAPSKSKPKASTNTGGSSAVETVEVLNPAAAKKAELKRLDSEGQTSGADADVDEPIPTTSTTRHDSSSKKNRDGDGEEEDEEEGYEPTELGKEFAKIKIGDYQACMRFIGEHPEVLAERETDGLLMEAFNAGMEEKMEYAKRCVHQGLLLQYCRNLGRDGVALFFKRITTPSHNAQKMFQEDVNSTYTRIASRTAELRANPPTSSNDPNDPSSASAGVEQIQLHATDPDSQIFINIPQPSSTDAIEIEARKTFETFPPGLQRAMESGKLERINEVLGKMSVEEAEEVVGKMGEGGMLSMERGVIDGTTEEGRQRLKDMEEERKGRKGEEDGEGGRGGDKEGMKGRDGLEEELRRMAEEGEGKEKDVEVADVD